MPLLLLTYKLMLNYFPRSRILVQQIPHSEFLLELDKWLSPPHGYLFLKVGDKCPHFVVF